MLVIRGSQSTMDWAINFDDEVSDFSYSFSAEKDGSNPATVQGHVHRGIYQVLQPTLPSVEESSH